MEKIANPTPFGLLGCSMAITLTNIKNAGLFNFEYIIVVNAILCGGLVQLIAGFLEYRNNNTFAFTTFSSYAIFWFSIIWYSPTGNHNFLAIYMFLWGIFTLAMFFCVLKDNFVLKFFFFGLTLLYFFSSIGNFFSFDIFLKISAYIGIITGLSAFYLSLAILINSEYDRIILPIGQKIR